MFGLGTVEIVLILVIVVLVFGAGRLSKIGRGLGEATREFRDVQQEITDAVKLKPGKPDRSSKDKGGK